MLRRRIDTFGSSRVDRDDRARLRGSRVDCRTARGLGPSARASLDWLRTCSANVGGHGVTIRGATSIRIGLRWCCGSERPSRTIRRWRTARAGRLRPAHRTYDGSRSDCANHKYHSHPRNTFVARRNRTALTTDVPNARGSVDATLVTDRNRRSLPLRAQAPR